MAYHSSRLTQLENFKLFWLSSLVLMKRPEPFLPSLVVGEQREGFWIMVTYLQFVNSNPELGFPVEGDSKRDTKRSGKREASSYLSQDVCLSPCGPASWTAEAVRICSRRAKPPMPGS